MHDLMGRRTPSQLDRGPGPLLEREAELAQFSAAFDQARLGRGSVVAIDGPSGIGKSRLMVEAAALANKRGLEVLMAAGRDIESQFAFGVVLQLFEARHSPMPMNRNAPSFCSGAATAAAPLLAPALGEGLPHERTHFQSLRGLYQVCLHLGRIRPLVLIVDDAHHADHLSLRFELYLAQRLEELPICLVVAGSLGRLQPAVDYLSELVSHPMTRRISLGALSPEAVALELSRASFPDASDEFCRSCFDATGGNPYLLHALAADLGVARDHDTRDVADVLEAGPESVAQSVLLRLDTSARGRSRSHRPLPFWGMESSSATRWRSRSWSRCTRLDSSTSSCTLTCWRAASCSPYVYPIVRRAVAAAMLPAERAAANLSSARVLDQESAPLEEVAGHLLQASRTGSDWVVGVLSAAAEAAMAAAMPESAVRYLRRALSEPPDQGQRATLMLRSAAPRPCWRSLRRSRASGRRSA